MKKLKIIFAGTSYFSAAYLNALINSEHSVIAVITQMDRPSGRGQQIRLSCVKKISEKNQIPIFQPFDLNEKNFQYQISTLKADMMIVVAYGKILPKSITDMFPMKCINVHASLLPRWRGATPIQSAIMHGDLKTGITIIEMNEKIDTGKILSSKKCNILSTDNTQTLSMRLIDIGIKILLPTLKKIIYKKINKKQQNEKYCTLSKKIQKNDGLINWNTHAIILERMIRAFNPWPICYFKLSNTFIKVLEAEVIPIKTLNCSIGEIIIANKSGIQVNTSRHILNIKRLQISGKKIMTTEQILCSKKNWFNIGTILK